MRKLIGGCLAVVMAAGLLSACKDNAPPRVNAPSQVSMDAARWSFQASPGMPASPAADPEGGWTFMFPQKDGVHYLVTGAPGYLGSSMRLKFRVETSADAVLRESDPCGGVHHPAVRLYFQRRGDKLTAEYEYYRWFSKPIYLVIGVGEVTVPLVASEWSSVFPRDNDDVPFAAAKADVQVVGLPDERFVETVSAWIRLKPGEMLTEDEVRKFCREHIAHYKSPQYIVFVDEYPTTVTGKVQKFKLREMGIERFGLHQAAATETA